MKFFSRKTVRTEPVMNENSNLPFPNDPSDPRNQLYLLIQDLEQLQHRVDLFDLRQMPAYRAAVDLLASELFSSEQRLRYISMDNALSIVALDALRREEWKDEWRAPILDGIVRAGSWWLAVALELLAERYPPDKQIIVEVLELAQPSWLAAPVTATLREFVNKRVAGGEEPDSTLISSRCPPQQVQLLYSLLARMELRSLYGMRRDLLRPRMPMLELDEEEKEEEEEAESVPGTQPRAANEEEAAPHTEAENQSEAPAATASSSAVPARSRVSEGAVKFLTSVGKLWCLDGSGGRRIGHSALLETVERMHSSFIRAPKRSVLLVGERGVGKKTAIRLLHERLAGEGWVFFEAGHLELIAGMKYVGTFEGRLQQILLCLESEPKIAWVIPDLQHLLTTGRHEQNPVFGALHIILPYIQEGRVLVVGMTEPEAFERLTREAPQVQLALDVVRIQPLEAEATVSLVETWLAGQTIGHKPVSPAAGLVRDGWNLARHFLSSVHPPGSLIDLMRLTMNRLESKGNPTGSLVREDLVQTLADSTGLPLELLDDRKTLDLDALRKHFEARVQGQREAVDCLVSRMAMFKAGLCDERRPLAVLLFAGPTGTGKTALVKALAEFMFGDPDRMIRLDMSELHGMQGLARIVGSTDLMRAAHSNALVHEIRSRPFSVVLLDEVEKTDPEIWDLFLQLFDDGRLTDAAGHTSDFRHAIIIMTTNLGGARAQESSLGFTADGERFHAGAIEREIARTFRREFVNRVDRTIVFHPLGRDTMRSILFTELRLAMERRGLSRLHLTTEWDEAAIDFLLEKGFEPELGARPLKRAIERYFLGPLAEEIIAPGRRAENSLLLVKVHGNRLGFRFLEPETTETAIRLPAVARPRAPLSLAKIAFDPEGTEEEIAELLSRYQLLCEETASEPWRTYRDKGLALMSAPGFWTRPDRFAIMGGIEYQERVKEGLERFGRWLERLSGRRERGRLYFPRATVGQMAERLYLLEVAARDVREERPKQAFLMVETAPTFGQDRPALEEFAASLGAMYRLWARHRGMRLDILEDCRPGEEERFRLMLAVSGFGSHSILALEHGAHVLEAPPSVKDERDFLRFRARVCVAPMEHTPHSAGTDGRRIELLRAEAERCFACEQGDEGEVVRRYREKPSPLVRDARRGYRTGKLERVLGGDFDIIPAEEED